MTVRPAAALLTLLVLATAAAAAAGPTYLPALVAAPNGEGVAVTLAAGGAAASDRSFFTSLGPSGRACATCHVPAEGWSLLPAEVRRRFEASGGLDPLFRPHDGAVSPRADVSTPAARRAAYALLLSRGLIRVGLPVPAGAEFELTSVADPYGFASARELSLFRRPLPATNLKFLSTVMWDGRESVGGRAIVNDLLAQAAGAANAHGGGEALSGQARRAIVDFERALLTAQVHDREAGALDGARAGGGPQSLAVQPFHFAINSAMDQTGRPPTTRVFTLFAAWTAAAEPARRAIARGEALFNERALGAGGGTCSGCHNAPNAGSSSTGAFFPGAAGDAPPLPRYTLACVSGPLAGRTFVTTDPGWALVTGRCADVERFKVPTLRGLAARPPYFHDGRAATLADVVDTYERRFGIGLTESERHDLVAFLRAL